jgi:hypothetical protein
LEDEGAAVVAVAGWESVEERQEDEEESARARVWEDSLALAAWEMLERREGVGQEME